jgi:hypothetical protein
MEFRDGEQKNFVWLHFNAGSVVMKTGGSLS